MIKLLFIIFPAIFSYSTFAMEQESLPRPTFVNEEPPAKKFKHSDKTIEIKYNSNFVKSIAKNKQELQKNPTGYTPDKKGVFYNTCTPLRDSLQFQINSKQTIMIEPVKSKTKRKLFEESDTEDSATGAKLEEDQEGENTAALERTPSIIKILYKPLSSRDTDFASGKWAYINPYFPQEAILFNSDHELWLELITALLEDINLDNQQNFIATTLVCAHRHLDKMQAAFSYPPATEIKCRHWATFFLPLVAKIFDHYGIPFNGTIRQITGEAFGPGWTSEPGHAWNLITFKSEEGEQHWLVDPANMFFIDLSAHDSITELFIYIINKKDYKSYFCSPLIAYENSFIWQLTQLTKEKFNIGSSPDPFNFYKREKWRAITARKIMSRFFVSDQGSFSFVPENN